MHSKRALVRLDELAKCVVVWRWALLRMRNRPDHRAQVYLAKTVPAGAMSSGPDHRLYRCEVIGMSRYMVLLYANESGMPKPGTPEFETQNAAYGAVYEDFARRGAFVSGDPLGPSSAATSVRIRDGKRQDTPGPAGSTQEQLIGYYVLNCTDQQEASALAASIPCAQVGTVEVRPVFEM
jgi:hypothetical protein